MNIDRYQEGVNDSAGNTCSRSGNLNLPIIIETILKTIKYYFLI